MAEGQGLLPGAYGELESRQSQLLWMRVGVIQWWCWVGVGVGDVVTKMNSCEAKGCQRACQRPVLFRKDLS